ncbi:MAG: S49 family peptidase [Desulfobacterales bacterium]
MNIAASGGYYVALPADFIMAHPTSVTGSVGVIFLQPKFYELMDKIGVGVAANTSGENKDMGSPFRKTSDAEQTIFQDLTDALGQRFLDLVVAHRNIDAEALADVRTARIYLADDALKPGLIDGIGYIDAPLPGPRRCMAWTKTARWWCTGGWITRMTMCIIFSPNMVRPAPH